MLTVSPQFKGIRRGRCGRLGMEVSVAKMEDRLRRIEVYAVAIVAAILLLGYVISRLRG
jgi:hypothetical protein